MFCSRTPFAFRGLKALIFKKKVVYFFFLFLMWQVYRVKFELKQCNILIYGCFSWRRLKLLVGIFETYLYARVHQCM